MDKTILRIKDVCDQLSLSKSTIYRMIKKGIFPPQIQLSERATGFRSSDISDWVDRKASETNTYIH